MKIDLKAKDEKLKEEYQNPQVSCKPYLTQDVVLDSGILGPDLDGNEAELDKQ